MKKTLAILLALVLVFALAACGGQTSQAPAASSGGEAPAASSGGSSAPAASSGSSSSAPAASSSGSSAPAASSGGEAPAAAAKTQPEELGFYDPEFDYTQFPRYKVAFLSMTAGETWDVYDVAYAHWCERMNIEYTHIWAPTQYSAEEFLSGLQTFIDQDYDGLILEASNNIPRAADILNKAGVQWVCGLSVPRDDAGTMLHPAIGFDNYDVGVKIVDRLVQWKEDTWPDVPWDKVGMLCLDFSWNMEIHQRVQGMEDRWAELHPEFGASNPDPAVNPQNLFIGDIATATNPDQTAAQNLTTQQLSNPGDIEVWLVATPADLYSQGAANAAALMNMTDKVCTACHGGSMLPGAWDKGVDDSWRYALYAPQGLAGEMVVSQLWAYMSGLATPDTIYPEWVNAHDHGGDGHSYAFVMMPLNFLEKETYQEYLEWTDLYTYGEGEKGVWDYAPVTDINLYPSRGEVPASYK